MILRWQEVSDDHVLAVATILEVAQELGCLPHSINGSFVKLHDLEGADHEAFVALCHERVAERQAVRAAVFGAFDVRPGQMLVEQDYVSFDAEADVGLKKLAADYVKAPSGLDAWKTPDLAKYGQLPENP
jgi:hypothetical protein